MEIITTGRYMKRKTAILSMLLSFSIMFGLNGFTDFDKACESAKKNHKDILIIFQGSDWCTYCMSTEEKVWGTDVFDDYVKKNCVVINADFPKLKKNKLPKEQNEKNKELFKKYDTIGGVPFAVLLDENCNVLGSIPYSDFTAEEYINKLQSFKKKKSGESSEEN